MKIPRPIVVLFCALPWIAIFLILGWFLLQRFPPNGLFEVVSSFDGQNAFVHSFLPAERASSPGLQPDGWTGQRLTDDPVYLSVDVPGPYQQAEVEMEFRPIKQPFVEFGVMRSVDGNDLELNPFYSAELQSGDWRHVPGGYVFRTTPPSRLVDTNVEGLAIWDASSTIPTLQDAVTTSTRTVVSLRGQHDFYVVPVDGMIDILFDLQDVNRARERSNAVIRVLRGDEELQREVFPLRGRRDTTMGPVIPYHLHLTVPPGVYHIALQMDNDIFIRAITTTSRHWVVGPRLSFGDVSGFATTTSPGLAWSNSRHLVINTFHQEGLQDVTFGPEHLSLIHTHETYNLNRYDAERVVPLIAPRGDITILGDGWFSLRPETFFQPRPTRYTDATQLTTEHITGVRTSYEPVEVLDDGWLRGRATFVLQPTDEHLRLVLSAPGIRARIGAVDVRRIKIRFIRPASSWSVWMDVVQQEVRNAWHRLD